MLSLLLRTDIALSLSAGHGIARHALSSLVARDATIRFSNEKTIFESSPLTLRRR